MSQVLLENSKAGFILVMGVKIALFGSKMASFGPWVFFLSDAKHLIFFALSAFSSPFSLTNAWTAKQEVSW